jgi:DNA-binding CsgD family transcriptional regulator
MILLSDPDAGLPATRDFIELFGPSPAESRLAAALIAGKRLRHTAADFGVQIKTLRSQLSSVLKKLGAKT